MKTNEIELEFKNKNLVYVIYCLILIILMVVSMFIYTLYSTSYMEQRYAQLTNMDLREFAWTKINGFPIYEQFLDQTAWYNKTFYCRDKNNDGLFNLRGWEKECVSTNDPNESQFKLIMGIYKNDSVRLDYISLINTSIVN